MVSLADIRSHSREIIDIAARHGAHDVRLFGSVVRGQTTEGSDLDILVRMDNDRSLLDHVALIRELEQLLGNKVDVVPEDALHRAIRDTVLKEAVAL